MFINSVLRNMSTRWYLDGHESFTAVIAAPNKIKPTENSHSKIGRFGTDYSYGGLTANSTHRQRLTTHATDASEGALGLALTLNRVQAVMAYPRFRWTDSATGIRNESVYNGKNGSI